ncbi:hypothetical protein NDU88_000804 [Pleurodeles waltl]|uniref:Uncharacterized protein n=1 Tax=Pleurodeles waltl TaxID=8319 RepID=A0AAV7VUK8_PLEWA|nr:hypothetical protein NDU88_000804 [Pleurodeles waltl]
MQCNACPPSLGSPPEAQIKAASQYATEMGPLQPEGHGGAPPGLRRHHQGGQAQQLRRAPPGSRALQIDCVVPGQAQSVSTASRGSRPDKTAKGPPSQRHSSPLGNGAAGRAHPGPTAASRQSGGSKRAAPLPAQPDAGRAPALYRLPRQQARKFTNREGPGPFTNASGRGERLQHP